MEVEEARSMRNDLECSECGGEDFAFGVLDGKMKIYMNLSFDVECTVCRSCGHVFTYIKEADLEKLRSLRAEQDAEHVAWKKAVGIEESDA
jgi:uncharacterized Zn finger protein